ncbi:sigma-54-dependent Fis family transcriptional regulator [Novosphingobium sp. 1949]|uniref:Sigma-54-dependent Fis family transcriptional regulator n=1 Tax=Novosphingobium organovorum TaxID=2930092 RepID=A0ABT0BD29_9SPHN|nr:sigma-54-dependent Fis family transcriptional regulator [Novosphingobium organovorum]MCJ2182960.1 sigma-54-dependent Fis family transcriptional regulator [Novosphingobium organovorum]
MANDLVAQLHFDPAQAHIWLAGRRMMLLHAKAFGLLRRELVDMIGQEKARGIFTRQGYNSGAMDAEAAAGIRPGAPLEEMFAVGPELHAVEGLVLSEPVRVTFDTASGSYYGEYLWKGSCECSAHIEAFGIGSSPGGWSQIGYASGYASVFLGRPIQFREVECVAMGHEHCRIVGRPAEDWTDGEADLRYMRGEQLNQIARTLGGAGGAAQPDGAASGGSAGGSRQEGLRPIVGASAGFNVAFDMLHHVADTDAVVLFLGESGVGKEVFARSLHRLGTRREAAFVAVNCAAIPESLVEAELFGVEKGAFTDATSTRPGRFERAEGGTLFLDEVGTLSLAAQGKLLRAIQEGEYERVGGHRTRKADVRLAAATNVDLRAAVQAGTFRSDLFYRLNVFPIRIPPLRERRADLPLLIEHFLHRYAARYGKTVPGIEERAVAAMLSYDWPGNIRELENIIERGVIMAAPGEPLRLHHLFAGGETLAMATLRLGASGKVEGRDPLDLAGFVNDLSIEQFLRGGLGLEAVEGRMIETALVLCEGNKTHAARLLGISRSQLNYRLAKGDEG